MALTSDRIQEITKRVVKKSFFDYFVCRKQVLTRHVLLHRLYPVESSIRSSIGGLETSLGITLWERIAKEIAQENGFSVLDPKVALLRPAQLPEKIRNLLADYQERREVPSRPQPITEYTQALMSELNSMTPNEIPRSFTRFTKGSGIDIYLRKGDRDYAFDLKTVQINAGSGVKFNESLMKWITFSALYQRYTNSNNHFSAHIVIPYDPHVISDWWTEFGGRAYPLDQKDLMLGDQFWDFISGCCNTLSSIIAGFDQLVSEKFHDVYRQAIHSTGCAVSIKILEETAQVKCLTPSTQLTEPYSKKRQWQCGCNHIFKASISWFKKPRTCPQCRMVLSS